MAPLPKVTLATVTWLALTTSLLLKTPVAVPFKVSGPTRPTRASLIGAVTPTPPSYTLSAAVALAVKVFGVMVAIAAPVTV